MIAFLERINELVWGLPALLLILCVGTYLTVKTGFAQFRLFPEALRSFLKPFSGKANKTDRSKKQALCTALAATVGTGNLAGVAGAIALGGPGAVFWMWICALLGMITKLAEAALAILYRKKLPDGHFLAGPMYMIQATMKRKWHWLGFCYAFFGVVASFGVGNSTQINTVVDGIDSALELFGVPLGTGFRLGIGVFLALIVYRILSKGVSGIGKATEKLVPVAAAFYIVLAAVAITMRFEQIPYALNAIVTGAFSPGAVTGGAVGSVFIVLRIGAARGVFTNEAGMGTASMAHAEADVSDPVEQGLMGIIEVFIDTILICTLTALVILCSGVPISFGVDIGIRLTTQAFVDIFGSWVSIFISVALCLFAFATVLGWGCYGLQCARYLFGKGAAKRFVLLQAVTVALSAVLNTSTLWLLAEILNGLMAIPNLIVLAGLCPQLCDMIKCHLYKQVAPDQSFSVTV
ncbi:MAG: sodium:alanine symporter family protein [Oscillospiraceae bacterium]|nr:sodium:alanine symporter family protein [Oscillospiraceae bacterium]